MAVTEPRPRPSIDEVLLSLGVTDRTVVWLSGEHDVATAADLRSLWPGPSHSTTPTSWST
jgi:hypothetical protein